MSDCEHNYQFMGLVYSHDSHPMAGTGACARYYEDKFFCTKCLALRYENKRYQGNSYERLLEGSMPKESTR